MRIQDIMQVVVFLLALLVLSPLLARYMAAVFENRHMPIRSLFAWIERLVYRACGIKPDEEMDWKTYTKSLLWFNLSGFMAVFLLQILQSHLPLNPQGLGDVGWGQAFNTAVSFATNTNWQSYAGESSLSYLTQMVGLTVQNFVSAATGITVLLAFIRGLVRKSSKTIGNFWADLTRSVVYVLLPLSIILAIALSSEGVIQSLSAAANVSTMEGTSQSIPMGPVASQVAIKQLGTNGGGFFSANSAHPFENPTPISNFLEMLAILVIPAGIVFMFGHMTGARRHAAVIFVVMLILFLGGLTVSLLNEYSANPALASQVNLEGKEVRFGIVNSVLWSVATTAASNGSVNAMHSSMMPLSGGVAIFNILLGEIIFGGVGAGMYGMLLFVLLSVFLAGLMVGRSPEYMGKKIEAREIQMAILAILLPNAVILIGAGVFSVWPSALSSVLNKGPHGLSEILYAFASTAGNNGSAFAGLNAGTLLYNLILGIVMLVGRFGVIIPCLVIAGSLANKKTTAFSSGTFGTANLTFAVILMGVIIIVSALTFLPVLSLGPVIEQFLMRGGIVF